MSMDSEQQAYFESQRKRIERDLATFSDPGGLVDITGSARHFCANWMMRGSPREAAFVLSPYAGIVVSVDGNKKTYPSFMADDGMSNLRHVAEMTLRSGSPEMFVPTMSRRKDTKSDNPSPATEYLAKLVMPSESGTTRVIVVTGEAGAGKTHVLRQLVHQQADLYLRGQTKQLFLYVNAQGRSLARLDEALATELQDLRVDLTYHSVETLARVGLLVPIIDGFDELLGVSGYDDPFNSLAGLLENLEGEGSLIASARSVYYEAEFLARAGSANGDQSWEHIPVEILDWDDDTRRSYNSAVSINRNLSEDRFKTLQKNLETAFKKHPELASKPLFYVRIADFALDGALPDGEDLPNALAEAYLKRELKQKLLDRQSQPMLRQGQLDILMQELAQEMWSQETRELDYASVREVADYVLQVEELGESVRKNVVDRMPTLAFLAHNGRHRRILFEHEVFFFYFLARSLVGQYLNGDDLRLALSRSAMPEFVAERVAVELWRKGQLSTAIQLQEALDRLAAAAKEQWLRAAQVQENAGLIVLALLREYAARESEGVVEGVVIRAVTLPGSHLRSVTLKACQLIDVAIRRVDLTDTSFLDCQASNLTMMEPVVRVGGDGTRLDIRELTDVESVAGVVVLDDDTGRRVAFAPQEVASLLRECGAPIAGEVEEERKIAIDVMELVNGLMRAYRRANPVCEADPLLQAVFRHDGWPSLRALLVEHGLVKEENRPSGGAPKTFLRRRFLPEKLMAGASRRACADAAIANFWDDLEAMGSD